MKNAWPLAILGLLIGAKIIKDKQLAANPGFIDQLPTVQQTNSSLSNTSLPILRNLPMMEPLMPADVPPVVVTTSVPELPAPPPLNLPG